MMHLSKPLTPAQEAELRNLVSESFGSKTAERCVREISMMPDNEQFDALELAFKSFQLEHPEKFEAMEKSRNERFKSVFPLD